MKKGIILQTRDFEILISVYEYTVASFESLKRKHFGHTNVKTASNRLNRLVDSGYLKGYRVGLMLYQGKERQVNKIFVATPLAFQILALKMNIQVLRTEIIHPQFYSLAHDLLLNDVLDRLKKENGDRKIVNSRLLKIVRSRTDQVPDLAMEDAAQDLNIAIELELTSKSEKRYREMITNYRMSSKWKTVVFVIQDQAIHAKILGLITGNQRTQESILPDHAGKFYFRYLKNLLPEARSQKDQSTDSERSAA